MPNYVWIYDNRQGFEHVSYNTCHEVTVQVNGYLLRLIGLFGTQSKINNVELWKNNYSFKNTSS